MSEQIIDWLKAHQITEVECLISDMAGIPRGKILPVNKYIEGLKSGGQRLPEYVFGQTVMGDYEDSEVLHARVGDVVLRPDEGAAYLCHGIKSQQRKLSMMPIITMTGLSMWHLGLF